MLQKCALVRKKCNNVVGGFFGFFCALFGNFVTSQPAVRGAPWPVTWPTFRLVWYPPWPVTGDMTNNSKFYSMFSDTWDISINRGGCAKLPFSSSLGFAFWLLRLNRESATASWPDIKRQHKTAGNREVGTRTWRTTITRCWGLLALHLKKRVRFPKSVGSVSDSNLTLDAFFSTESVQEEGKTAFVQFWDSNRILYVLGTWDTPWQTRTFINWRSVRICRGQISKCMWSRSSNFSRADTDN
jgi:hypothetical protein